MSEQTIINHKTTVVDIYCRVSTDDQEDNTSLDEQEATGRKYCQENGFIVGMIHREVFSGYYYREREKLAIMRERYQVGKIQGVVIRTLDRLSRSQVHNAILMEEMEHKAVVLHCVKEKIDDTPMGKFTRMILSFVAEMEREKIMDRTMTGRMNKAKEGKASISGYKLLYGFMWNDPEKKDFPVINKEQASVIQEMGERYANGENCEALIRDLNEKKVTPPSGESEWTKRNIKHLLNSPHKRLDYTARYPEHAGIIQEIERMVAEDRSGQEIIDELNEREIPAPEEQWGARTLRRILTDNRITGKNVVVFHKHNPGAKKPLETVQLPDGTYPAIISTELAQRIQERARTNQEEASKRGKNPEEYLLRSGFIKCHCGRTMAGVVNTHKPDAKHSKVHIGYIYKCVSSRCHYAVNAKKMDKMIWEKIEALAEHTELIAQAIKIATSDTNRDNEANSIEASLSTWRAKAQNYLEDLDDTTLRGDSRASVRQSLNHANMMIEQLETERVQVMLGMVDKEREQVIYQNILDWCHKVKEAKQAKEIEQPQNEQAEQPKELSYQEKRDFFRMLGLVVMVEKRDTRKEEIAYEMKIRLPEIQELIQQQQSEFSRTHSVMCVRLNQHFLSINASGIQINPELLQLIPEAS